MYLEKINSPKDLKKYSVDEMKELAKEMRAVLLKKLSIHGRSYFNFSQPRLRSCKGKRFKG